MQPSRLLYQDFPVEIRRFYGDVAQIRDWHGRHEGLVAFADLALSHLASLALSDYRSRTMGPDAKVENLLERAGNRNMTLGLVLQLFQLCCQAITDPMIPPPKDHFRSRLSMVGRFVAAIDALELAVAGQRQGFESAAIDVPFHVGRGLQRDVAEIDWWAGWSRLVEYRNKVIHASQSRWPTLEDGFWETMTPLFHDALVDLLTEDLAAEAVLAHPVVSLAPLGAGESGSFLYAACVEDRGVLFDEEIETPDSVVDRWRDVCWDATTASSFILDRLDDRWSVRGLFWDLRNGLPPVMRPAEVERADRAPRLTLRDSAPLQGRGVAPGTCGEFAQGVLPDLTPFHVTCPINKSATVLVGIRPAATLTVLGLSEHHRKLGLAIENAVRSFGLGPVEVLVRHWSDIDIGKGMGSSTADVLAGIRAVAEAAGQQLDARAEGELAAEIESSDGSMYSGIAAVNHRTCELIKPWDWFPEFTIVMLVPHDTVNTSSIPFTGQEELAQEYGDLLEKMDAAIDSRSIADFAAQSTRSAILNNRFLLNPYCSSLSGRLADFGALGINVGHTGTVCGLLFPNSEDGRLKASEACFEVRRKFTSLKDVKVVTTPFCESASGEDNGQGGDAANSQ